MKLGQPLFPFTETTRFAERGLTPTCPITTSHNNQKARGIKPSYIIFLPPNYPILSLEYRSNLSCKIGLSIHNKLNRYHER